MQSLLITIMSKQYCAEPKKPPVYLSLLNDY